MRMEDIVNRDPGDENDYEARRALSVIVDEMEEKVMAQLEEIRAIIQINEMEELE